MDVKGIEYLRELTDKKFQLEQELNLIEEKIVLSQSECNHVAVRMKTFDVFPNYGNSFRCLICGRYISYVPEVYIDARNSYNELEDDEKFDVIQTMAIGIIRQNPQITKEDFVKQLNQLIKGKGNVEKQENEIETGNQFTKKLTTK